jgi:hypothetical protein
MMASTSAGGMLWNWPRIFAARVELIRSLGQELVQRRQGDRTVAENFDVEATGAEGNHRSEDRVAEDTDHQLTAVRARQEGLDRDTIDLGIRPDASAPYR